ncbi:MAG: chemotaxis response regulator protein-glutamate methylesterase [Alphaproteobacteria bacterium]|nr:chemotaxis response regulator protein-glutamate methylesterase [Alphaproteobacteria bacterium]
MTTASPAAPSPAGGIRVLVVDDSAVVRGLVTRWIKEEPGFELAGVATNGKEAVTLAGTLKPDVMILDVEMPELDGVGAIPKVLAAAPGVRILMASTLTQRNAEITLRCLSLGAADYVPKPETGRIAAAADFRRDLVARVRALGQRRRPGAPPPRPSAYAPSPAGAAPAPARAVAAPLPGAPGKLRPGLRKPADVLVIGCSTGGPQALNKVIAAIGPRVRVPVLIVQHMPAMFTAILAEHLGKLSRAPVMEAKDGMPVRPGSIYVAPGDFHMRLQRRHGALVAALDQGPAVNFCRPAVDPLFQSAAEIFGPGVLGAVLTGMGADGRRGAEAIVERGGAVIAQDEATSVVWGMPGAVTTAGLVCAVKPIDEIGRSLLAYAEGRTL